MGPLLIGLILVPLIDQTITAFVRRRLGARSIRLGPLGEIRVAPPRLEDERECRGRNITVMWVSWLVVAIPMATLCAIVTPTSWPGSIVLGASLSQIIETSQYGTVCPHIRFRGGSAFSFARVAMMVGGLVFAFEFHRALYVAW